MITLNHNTLNARQVMARSGKNQQVYLKHTMAEQLDLHRVRANEDALARGDVYQYTKGGWLRHLINVGIMSCLVHRDGDVVTTCEGCDRDILHDEDYFFGEEHNLCSECAPTAEELEAAWREDAVPKEMMYVAHLDDTPEYVGFGATKYEAVCACLERNNLDDGEHFEEVRLYMTHPVVASDHISFDAEAIAERVDLAMWSQLEEYNGDDRGLGLSCEQDKEVEGLLAATLKRYLRERNIDRQDYFAPGRLIRSQQAQFEIVDGELSRFMFVSERAPEGIGATLHTAAHPEYAAYCERLEASGYTVIGHAWLGVYQIFVARGAPEWMGAVFVSLPGGGELPEVPTFF